MSLSKLAGVILLLCAGNAFAQERSETTLETGFEHYQETYRETVNGAPFMQEKSDMNGVYANLNMPLSMSDALAFSVRYAAGKSKYTGGKMGAPYGSLIIHDLDRYSAELTAAYEFHLLYMTPSAGIGYRRLVDRLDQAGAGGYKRTSEYMFLTVGVSSIYDLTSLGVQLTPRAEYRYLLRGRQHSADIVNEQHSGEGLELSVALSGQLTPTMGWRVTPYYRYWQIADSDQVDSPAGGTLMEPRNTTQEIGARVSLTF
jgi:hypothetical protein